MNPDIEASRSEVLDFLANHSIGVLATADKNGTPHAATIYVVSDRTLTFYFVTKAETQKARNLAANPHAAIAIYDARSQTTLQISGAVTQVTDVKESEGVFTRIRTISRQTSASDTPPVAMMSAGGYVTYKLIAPSVRLAHFGRHRTEPFEGTLV